MPKQQLPKEKKWYALQTQTGLEEIAAKALRQRIESLRMQNKIFNVLVPKEKKIKVKNGKKIIEEEKIFPGYVLVEMIVDDESWYVARNTPNITGFLGSGITPVPLDEKEIEEILKRTQEKEPEYKIDFSEGDLVRILEEPFKDFEGKVVEVDKEKGKLKVLIQIFGKETPVELDYFQVKKL